MLLLINFLKLMFNMHFSVTAIFEKKGLILKNLSWNKVIVAYG